MAKITIEGFDEYLAQLRALEADAEKICKAVVYPGAAILADALRAETDALKTISDTKARNNFQHGLPNDHLSDSQKAGLQAGFGITPIRRGNGGMIQCSVGFSGYNSVVTQHFPNGQPNPEVARSLEKGTSYLKRDKFVSRAVKAAKAGAEAAMKTECDAQIQRIMDENAGSGD